MKKGLNAVNFPGGVTPTPIWPVSYEFRVDFSSYIFAKIEGKPGITVSSENAEDYLIMNLSLAPAEVNDAEIKTCGYNELCLAFTGVFPSPGTYTAYLEIYNGVDEEQQFGECQDFVTVHEDGTISCKYLVTD